MLKEIAARPRSFPVVFKDMRKASAHPFPYGVFDQKRGGRVYVVAIVDLRRHPRTWKRRALK